MAAEALSREVALRIGLAARVIPDADPRRLMSALVDAIGMPITEEKLSAVTVQQLRSVADGMFQDVPLPALKEAVDWLWGKRQVEVDEDLPVPEPYQEGDMPGSIRVAVASNLGELLDGHFGSCARFLVYQVSAETIRLVDVRAVGPVSPGEDKNQFRANTIADCHVLYVVSIGGPAAAKVVRADIHPVKFPNGGLAQDALQDMQRVLADTPPPWLAKVMGVSAEERMRAAQESWS